MLIRVVILTAATLTIPARHGPGDGRAGPDAAQVTTLLAALERTDPVICEMAVDAFGHGWYGWGRASGVGVLGDVPAAQRETQALMRRPVTDPMAVPVLANGIASGNACVRRAAASLLGESRAAGAVEALRTALSARSAPVREAAAYGLGTAEDHQSVPALLRALDDRDPKLVAMSAWALGEIGDPVAIPALQRVYASADAATRLEIVAAAARIDAGAASGLLMTALKDADPRVRKRAAEALGDSD